MKKNNVCINVNDNFHHAAGEDLFRKNDGRFEEYRNKWSQWPCEFFVGNFPLFIDVEVTSSCNLKCPFCATTFRKNKIKQGFIKKEMVKKIIDEGKDNGLYGVKFNIRGEPLLHPEIVSFIKYAKKNGLIDIYFNTNAVLLSEDISKKLIDAGLDRLSISFEGHTKDVYEKHRVGAKFEKVLRNIDTIQKLKKRLGVVHPKVRIQTVMLPDVAPDFEVYKNFWAGKADEVAYLDYKEMKAKKTGIKYGWACPQLWQRMAVWWDGTILPCNHDDDALLSLGNVNTAAIKSAWHSDELNELRKKHKNGQAHLVPACDGCYLRDSEIAKELKKG